jgi:hypothetical protein
MVVRKLCGQSFGAVQQHRGSTASCRPPRKVAIVGLALLLKALIPHIAFSASVGLKDQTLL